MQTAFIVEKLKGVGRVAVLLQMGSVHQTVALAPKAKLYKNTNRSWKEVKARPIREGWQKTRAIRDEIDKLEYEHSES